MTDIFISYAREDELRVSPLASALEQKGWSVFWDNRIPAGQTWRSYIGRNLDEARCVIAVWSQHSVNSRWVSEEADEGQKRGILVPVLFDSVDPPMGFRSVQAADLRDWRPDQTSQRFEQLILDIKTLLKAAPVTSVKESPVAPPPKIPTTPSEAATGRGGFSARHLAYACLILVLIGVGGYWVYQRSSSVQGQTEPQPSDPAGSPGSHKGGRKLPVSGPKESPAPPRIYSQGQLVVRDTLLFDLDAGAEVDSYPKGDFYWNYGQRSLECVCWEGGWAFVLGLRDFESVGYDDLQRLQLSGRKVEPNADNKIVIPIQQGSVVAYKTKQGRLGKFKVEQYGEDLTIRWVTFATM
jgi:hypothetical protein